MVELKRSATFVVALGFAIFVGSSKVEAAQADFDGLWEVKAKVEQGSDNCVYLLTYTYDVQIFRGSITSAQDKFTMINGRVDRNGTVKAHVDRGDHSVEAIGSMLSQTSGSGSWHSKHCAGSWSADKRE